MITWILIGAAVLALFFGVAIYNGLVRLRQLVREAFSGITVQLRRRADLIPNLVETVKGYATHERETFEAITAQRDAAMTGLLGRLMVVAEAYPQLQADENFRQLQGELTSIEDELQSARRYYNATARDLNTKIQSFPDMLFARPMGFTEEPYYEDADASIQTAPKVDFARPA